MAIQPQYRRVRTPEGAQFYGLPIGSLILPNAMKAAVKSHGGPGPESALGKVGDGDDASWVKPLSGPQSFKVGNETFTAPKGARLFRSKDGKYAYVMEANGDVAVFSEQGQLNLSKPLLKQLRGTFKDEQALGSSKYVEEPFDSDGESAAAGRTAPETSAATSFDAASASAGTVVTSSSGDMEFTKQEDGSWAGPFEIEATDSTIQQMVDSGAASPAEAPSEEAAQTSAPEATLTDTLMSPDISEAEYMSALDAAADGEYVYANAHGAEAGWVKNRGAWHFFSPDTGSVDPSEASPLGLWYVKSFLQTPPSDLTLPKIEPSAAVESAPKTPRDKGDLVTSADFLDDLAPDSTLRITANPDGVTGGYTITKQDNGEWVADDNELISAEEIAHEIATKSLFVDTIAPSLPDDDIFDAADNMEYTEEEYAADPSSPGSTAALDEYFSKAKKKPVVKPEEPAAPSVKAKPVPQTLQPKQPKSSIASLFEELTADAPKPQQVGGKMVTDSHLKEAIAGLEAHSGFQVAYGLKGLGTSNPFSSKEFQDAVKVEAANAFPDLKPKPAFVAYLKKKAGQEVEVPKVVNEPDGSEPTMTIGSANPKKVGVQGMDGGVFTKSQIDEAIALLEGFEGKAFKAYLNKNGNALGVLDPNQIVGFHKDKTEGKKAFLALLKQKSASFVAPDVDMPDGGEAKHYSVEELNDLPAGTQFEMGGQEYGQISTYEKLANGEWKFVTSDDPEEIGALEGAIFPSNAFTEYPLTVTSAPNAQASKPAYAQTPAAAEKISTPAPKAPTSGLLDPDDKDKVPNGAYVKHTVEGYSVYIHKNENGQWVWAKDTGLLKAGTDVVPPFWKVGFSEGSLEFISAEDLDGPPKTPAVTLDSLSDAPQGSLVSITDSDSGFTDVWEKTSGGDWELVFVGDPTDQQSLGTVVIHQDIANSPLNKKFLTTVEASEIMGKKVTAPDLAPAAAPAAAPEPDTSDPDFSSDGHQSAVPSMDSPDFVAHVANADPMAVLKVFPDGLSAKQEGYALLFKPLAGGEGTWTIFETGGEAISSGLSHSQMTAHLKNKSFKAIWSPDGGSGTVDSYEAPTPSASKKASSDVSWKSAKDAPVGSVIYSSYGPLTKKKDNSWSGPEYFNYSDANTDAGLANGTFTKTSPSQKINAADAPIGTVLTSTSVGGGKIVKSSKNGWDYLSPSGGTDENYFDNHEVQTSLDAGSLVPDAPLPEQQIVPGKYHSGGKAFMVVKADGSGVYVNSKGEVSALTKDKVKKNFDAGMKNYDGLVDDIPQVTQKKVIKVKDVDKIPEGTYFAGDPNDLKTPVYEVKGDKITVTKPAPAPSGASAKINGKPNMQWADLAGVGATVLAYDDKIYRKTKEGPSTAESWVREDGKTLADSADYVYTYTFSYHSHGVKILSHGTGDPVEVPLKKAKTLFSTGKFVDASGNSVVPEGYTGAVTFFGSGTTVAALAKAQEILTTHADATPDGQPTEFTSQMQQELAEAGVTFVAKSIKKATAAQGLDMLPESYFKVISDQVDAFMEGVEIETPEGLGKDAFTYDSLGNPVMPPSLMTASLYSKKEKNAFVKAASEAHQGTIGLNPLKMDEFAINSWINAYKSGDFAKIYSLDVAASTKPGAKPLMEGHKHPGSPENEDTHKVTWGPAVEGEIPAGSKVPGSWTTESWTIKASAAEVDNYLIAAQMQNPTFLSPAEKRQWYSAHKAGHKQTVDLLSYQAKQRSVTGKTLSEPLVWTDDLKPAKSYDLLFESGPNPTSGWDTTKAQDWLSDQPDEIGLKVQDFYDAVKAQNPYALDSTLTLQAVKDYFSAKAAEEYAKSLIPVFTKKPVMSIQKGTNPISEWTDQFGNEYVFKPRAAGQEFRADIELLGTDLGRMWGFSSAESSIKTDLEGPYGLLQKKFSAIGDLMEADYSTLSATQIGDIASEHVLDWVLDNDDSKGDNMLVLPNGRVVGIDKGRTFVHFGHWQGLTPGQMNTNAHTVYSQMLDAITSGKVDKETAEAAYLQMQRRIKKIQKTDLDALHARITDAMEHRTKGYDITYSIDGKPVPKTLDGLLMAVDDRISRLDADFEKLWADTFKKAGYGDLPEVPAKAIDGMVSGFDDPDFHTNLIATKYQGQSVAVSGASVKGGSVHAWTEKTATGDLAMAGEFFVGPKAQGNMLDLLTSQAVGGPSSDGTVFPSALADKFWGPILAGAKTITHHAVDLEYNQSKINEFNSALDAVNADLVAWSLDMPKSNGMVAFPSGNKVPEAHLPQYRMMLEHMAAEGAKAKAAYEKNEKIVNKVEAYSSVKLSNPAPFSGPDGAVAYKTVNGWMVAQGGTVSMQTADWSPEENGFAQASSAGDVPTKGYTVKRLSGHHYKEGKIVDGTKTLTDSPLQGAGVQGHEFEIRLDSGEVIYFRNASQTGTDRSNRGMVSFRVDSAADDPQAVAVAMERISGVLQEFGIDLTAAEQEHAENTYWRQMYDITMRYNLNLDTSGLGKKHSKVKARIEAKTKEIGSTLDNFQEDLAASFADAQAEAAWWREVYAEGFGTETIDKVVSAETWRPQFTHLDLENPDQASGKPSWTRFDVNVADLIAQDALPINFSGKHGGNADAHAADKSLTGFMSTEERLRTHGHWIGGASSSADQPHGSSHSIWLRLRKVSSGSSTTPDNLGKITHTIFNPSLFLRTDVYSYEHDQYGEIDLKSSMAPIDPLYAMKNFNTGNNESMPQTTLSTLDHLELQIFDDAARRQAVLDGLRARGIEAIRGLPIEDRFVMRAKYAEAIKKVRATWQTQG